MASRVAPSRSIFLSIYATLCSLYLCHAHALQWFNLGADFHVQGSLRRFVTMVKPFSPTTFPCFALRRVWDPGINSSRLSDTSIMLTVTMACAPTTVRLIWDPPNHTAQSTRPPATASLFHYSHPVLSRPAMPNIDSSSS